MCYDIVSSYFGKFVRTRLYTLCKKAGIEKQSSNGHDTLSPHADRRSMSRSIRSNGSNARSVMSMMSRSGSKAKSPRHKPRTPKPPVVSPPPGA